MRDDWAGALWRGRCWTEKRAAGDGQGMCVGIDMDMGKAQVNPPAGTSSCKVDPCYDFSIVIHQSLTYHEPHPSIVVFVLLSGGNLSWLSTRQQRDGCGCRRSTHAVSRSGASFYKSSSFMVSVRGRARAARRPSAWTQKLSVTVPRSMSSWGRCTHGSVLVTARLLQR